MIKKVSIGKGKLPVITNSNEEHGTGNTFFNKLNQYSLEIESFSQEDAEEEKEEEVKFLDYDYKNLVSGDCTGLNYKLSVHL